MSQHGSIVAHMTLYSMKVNLCLCCVALVRIHIVFHKLIKLSVIRIRRLVKFIDLKFIILTPKYIYNMKKWYNLCYFLHRQVREHIFIAMTRTQIEATAGSAAMIKTRRWGWEFAAPTYLGFDSNGLEFES